MDSVFYKERQKFFDAVKAARAGEFPVITYNKKRYKLVGFVSRQDFNNYIEEKRFGYYVFYSKKRRHNVIQRWLFTSKNLLHTYDNIEWRTRLEQKHVLCFAELLNI